MGTRHLILVYYRGRYCVAQYGQYDGYVEDAGVKILHFLLLRDNIDSLKRALDDGSVYEATPETLRRTEHTVQEKTWKFRRFEELHPRPCPLASTFDALIMNVPEFVEPSLANTTGPKILYLIANASPGRPVPLKLTMDDWSPCEWVYVVDLDKEQFEVYSGFTPFSAETVDERFDAVDASRGPSNSVPRHLQMYDFNSLPSPDQLCQDCTPTSEDDGGSTDSENDTESCSNTHSETGFPPPTSQPSRSLKKRKCNAADTSRPKRPRTLRGDKRSTTPPKRRATEADIQNLRKALNIKAQDVIALIQWHTNTADLVRRVNAERLRQVNDHIRRHGWDVQGLTAYDDLPSALMFTPGDALDTPPDHSPATGSPKATFTCATTCSLLVPRCSSTGVNLLKML